MQDVYDVGKTATIFTLFDCRKDIPSYLISTNEIIKNIEEISYRRDLSNSLLQLGIYLDDRISKA